MPVLVDLQDFGEVRPERLANEAAGFGQHLVQVLAAQGEVAEAGEHPLPRHHLLAIGHAPPLLVLDPHDPAFVPLAAIRVRLWT